ncbi:MAG: hypothetical protein QNJ30_01505 [Kiloniellales bacterium]|nr:hypothetical protein [Kiloniellales bacterium]
MSAPAETADPKQRPAAPRASLRWLFAALGLYVSLLALLRYGEFLLVEVFGPNPCCIGETISGTRLASLTWLGLCLLAAFLGRSFTICLLFPEIAWPSALWRAFKGLWVIVAAGTLLISGLAPGLWNGEEQAFDGFLLVLTALISGPAQAYLGGLALLRPGLQMLWRHAALAIENGVVLLLASLGVLSFVAACSKLGGLYDLRLACP